MGCVENINSYAQLRPKSANVGLGFLLKSILIVRGGRLRESSLQNVGNIVYNHLILRLLPVGVDNPSTRVAKSKTIKNPFCSCVRDDLSSPTVPTV